MNYKKYKRFVIKLPQFATQVDVFLYNNEKAFEEKYPNQNANIVEADGYWVTINIHKGNCVSTVAHECMHAAFAVGRRRSITHSESSEEFYTYTMDYLLGEILKRTKVKFKQS